MRVLPELLGLVGLPVPAVVLQGLRVRRGPLVPVVELRVPRAILEPRGQRDHKVTRAWAAPELRGRKESKVIQV